MDLRIAGKTALVTGGSQGIGKGIAVALASEGCRIGIVARDGDALESCLDHPSVRGTDARAFSADLATAAGVAKTIGWAKEVLGGVDILVNNAGGSIPCGLDADDDVWERSFLLNFVQVRALTTGLLPGMMAKRWGRVVNITGGTAARVMNASSPAKAAVQSWAKSLAFEVAASGITVNCVAPGRIDSVQVRERLHPDEKLKQEYIATNIAVGRFGEPEELADLVAFLASERAGYITGATVPVDGGQYRLAL